MSEHRFKFGDPVENIFASIDNPYKYGYFVRHVHRTGHYIEVTDKEGVFWESEPDGIVPRKEATQP